MRRLLSLFCVVALCIGLMACSGQDKSGSTADSCEVSGHHFNETVVSVEPYGGMDGKKEQICSVCGYIEMFAYPVSTLVDGNTFTMTIRQFAQRLTDIGSRVCPGLTVSLVEDDWCVTTQLMYNGELFCELTYFDNDGYLGDVALNDPMGADQLDSATIRYVNVLDYVDAEHAPNSFSAIAMTFDPLITEAEAQELSDYLAATRRDYYGNYLVTAINGVGYGHAYPVNQMVNSGSIAIHAGAQMPELCVHDPDFVFSGDGVPSGYCKKCDAYVSPAGDNWVYLTNMEVLDHSDNSSKSADIVVENWEDPIGAVYWNALRFWVAKQPGLTNSEYIEYALTGQQNTLSGSIVSSVESDPSAVMRVEIYADDVLVFASGYIGYYDTENYMLDISGAEKLRVVCITDTPVHGYCVVTGALY